MDLDTLDLDTRRKALICFGLNIGAAVALLSVFYFSALGHRAADRLHGRYWNYAIPAAVSEMNYGLEGYRAYVSVLMRFVDNRAANAMPEAADRMIASAGALPDVGASGVYLFPGDEKGLQDFVTLAFRLFGPKIGSLRLLYFAMLTTSVVLHAICFARRPTLHAIQTLVLAAILATVPALLITSELWSVLNPRAFGLLALPATVSLMCLAAAGEAKAWQLPLFAVQTLLVVFVMNVRNAEAWQLAAPCLIAAGLGVAAWRSRGDIAGAAARSRRLGACVAVVALVCGVFFPVQAVMRARLAPEYLSTKLVYKIFWHNVGIGFSVSPYFRDTYNLALSDSSYLVFVAQSPEVATAGEPGRRVFWTGTYTGQWVGGDPEIPEASAMNHVGMVRDFAGYERFARQVVFRLAQSHPWPTIKLFLYDKPKLLVRQLVNAIAVGAYSAADLMLEDQSGALLDGQSRRALRAYLQPVSIPSIIAVAIFAGCLVASRRADRSAIIAMPAILLALSTLPLLATYPLVHLMASFLAAGMFAVLVCAGFVCAALFDRFGATAVVWIRSKAILRHRLP